ncbi:MAG TPA: spermidine/putrescine ABC transporter ATP-binding protein, partial [Citreicella sp.]|nr:spermidine/putrescine ABC transporter ATP-binding protein [Citreicella sp.]
PARNALRGRLVQRVFAGAMATCLIEVEGSPWKLVARDRDIPDLPGAGEVWLSWAARDTIAVPA